MATDTEVLRSFLISLGFQVDQGGFNKFTGGIASATKGAKGLGTAAFAAAAAAQAMVASFASNMEKLYYASKRTGSSVDNLLALESGSRRIGLAAGVAQEALESMSGAVRMNPGLRGLMNMLTGQDTGKMDQTKAMIELVKKLSEMPHAVGARYASMFGIDEKTFLMLKQGMPELIAAQEKYNDLLRWAGVDGQKAAEAGKEYMNTIRDLGDKVDMLAKKLSITLLPAFKSVAKQADEFMDSLIHFDKIDFSAEGAKGAAKAMWSDIKDFDKEGSKNLHEGWKKNGYNGDNWWTDLLGTSQVPKDIRNKRAAEGKIIYPASSTPASSAMDAGKLFNQLEEKYKLPAGLLDRVWETESKRGQNMLSPKGAKGHFQFMDDTAKEYGVSDPNDLMQSSTGAARYISDLMKRYNGDVQKAMAAYNWGMGNFDRKGGLGALPAETSDYVRKTTGQAVTINQKTDIHVNGAGDPKAIGNEVLRGQVRVNGDIVRNTTARVQ